VAAPAPDIPSIAVLPFVNRSRDEDDEYFSDGLADELLNVLAKIRGLRVAARTSSFQFKGKSEDLTVIGEKLHVATLLEGSVRKSGNRVRIAVQLVKVSDGYQLWSETYDRTLEDIFAVQDDIAQSVVKELRATLLGEEPDSKASGEVKAEVAAAAKGRGTDAEAHRLFLQGRYLVNRLARQDVATGIDHLRRAVEVDSGHALAWACLSWAHALESNTGMAAVEEGMARARETARRALALEPDLAEGHLALGTVQLWYDWDWKSAEASYRRALQLAPGNAEVLRAAGILNYDLGRLDEALALCRRAIEQDPLSVSSYNYFGRVCRGKGLWPEAETAFRKALEISPESVSTHFLLSMVLDAQGRGEEALAVAMNEAAEWARLCALAVLHHTGGRPAEADEALRGLNERHAGHAAYQIALAHAVRGETDAAFEWLERAYAQRDSGLAIMKPEPLYRTLHADPRWAAFLAKMGLAD
jgi:TolB-like protein